MIHTKTKLKQRDIWRVNFTPQVGSELMGIHACVILQRDEMNKKLPTTVVAPLVRNLLWEGHPNAMPDYAIQVHPTAMNGLDVPRWVDVSQIRCIDLRQKRVISQQGVLEEEAFWEIEKAFYSTFGDIFPPPQAT